MRYHGFLRHKVVSDTFANCPTIAAVCPEYDVELNIQMVAMISAPGEKLTGSHCLRPGLDWRCKLDAQRESVSEELGVPVSTGAIVSQPSEVVTVYSRRSGIRVAAPYQVVVYE